MTSTQWRHIDDLTGVKPMAELKSEGFAVYYIPETDRFSAYGPNSSRKGFYSKLEAIHYLDPPKNQPKLKSKVKERKLAFYTYKEDDGWWLYNENSKELDFYKTLDELAAWVTDNYPTREIVVRCKQ